MTTYKFHTKKEVKTYKEISNIAQGIYGANEMIRKFQTDEITKHENQNYDTRFEEVR
jgi:hypothetical protein